MAKPNGGTPTSTNSIMEIAQKVRDKAQNEWKQNGGGSSLKGELKNATFKDGKKGSDFGGNICKITKEYTNDRRDYKDTPNPNGTTEHNGPCTGKDQRFIIGKDWEKDEDNVNPKHKDVLIPPRRKHMCTSNLENLNTTSGPLSEVSNVNNSFLGDVLLSAFKEADNITKSYPDKSDDPGKCRAVRSSFADLGDIIRGKDLWSGGTDMSNLQKYLKEIFKKIKEQKDIQDKYNGDNDYKQLREDWWTANRDQVWEAMKCHVGTFNAFSVLDSSNLRGVIKMSPNCGYGDGVTPLDDYIPQRLRWMTEWTENYCKQLDRNFKSVEEQCNKCKNNTPCDKNNDKCDMCSRMCNTYKEHVDKWKPQWEKQKTEYKNLYDAANSTSTTTGSDPIKEQLDDFFKKLKDKDLCNKNGGTGDTTTYDTLATYVTSMGGTKNCIDAEQKEFGDDKTSDNQYAFREKPHKYKSECECTQVDTTTGVTTDGSTTTVGTSTESGGRSLGNSGTDDSRPPNPPKPMPNPNPNHSSSTPQECKIDQYIQQNDEKKNGPKDCNPKYDTSKTDGGYPDWKCEPNMFESGNDGACMPPRRQKLCVHHLEHISPTTQDGLKDALLKSVSLETYLHWDYYIKHGDGKGRGLDDKLKTGEIPDEFKRQMFYTLGDFRDFVLDTDISKNDDEDKGVGKVKKKIKEVFSKNGGTQTTPQNWWDSNATGIWEAMVCALTHGISDTEVQKTLKSKNEYSSVTFGDSGATKLSEFVKRPQFLRWMTEWGEQFCRRYTKEYGDLVSKCSTCTNTTTCENCQKCKDQCEKYNTWLQKWKPNYEKQKKKYSEVKNKSEYTTADPDVQSASDARQYLQKKLQNMKCTKNGGTKTCDYKCMDEESSSGNDKIPKSLVYPPEKYETKCVCTPKPVATKPEVPRPQAAKPHSGTSPDGGGKDTAGVTPKNGPGPTKSKENQDTGPKSASSSTTCTGRDNSKGGDEGTCPGGPPIVAPEGQGTLSVVTATSNTAQSSDPKASDPNSGVDTSSSSSSAPSVQPPAGGGGGGNSGGVPGSTGSQDPDGSSQAVTGAATTGGLDSLWQKITGDIAPFAVVSGAAKAIDTATKIGLEATQLGIFSGAFGAIEAVKTGLKAAEKVLEKRKDTNSTSPVSNGPNSDPDAQAAGPAQTNLQPSVAEPDPSLQANSHSGSSSTGNQNPGSPRPGTSGGGGPGGGQQTVQSQVASSVSQTSSSLGGQPPGKASSPAGVSSSSGPTTPTQSGISTTHILNTTLPLGISIALGSIALLYYLKKKTTATRPTDLFRVLEIPQNDGGMPTYKSTNKYVPYTKYRGKTYIYVENDDSDTYVMESDTTDITSSDSEVDELDINDIYGYGGGKHKTLIDIILKPSGTNTRGSTDTRGTTDIVDTPYSDTNIHSNTILSGTTIPSDNTTPSDTHSTSGNHIYSDTIHSDTTDIVDNTYSDTTTPSGTDIVDTNIRGSTMDIVDNIVEPTTHSDNTTYSGNHLYSDNHIPSNTHSYSDIPGISDIPTSSDTIPGDTTYSNTTTYSDTHFIIQIQDRQLGGGKNTYIYDVGGGTTPSGTHDTQIYTTDSGGIYSGNTTSSGTPGTSGTNIYTTTHNVDNTTYGGSNPYSDLTYSGIYTGNHLYSGTDLIHDSLYSDRHIDIYEELLKRKEQELHSGRHTT
ncbi:erythrocyte membrane protein 1, PfEMP1, putative [Plasmodium sp. DRC-Itaito]|nr:erythrocyte membrane protein 1, PfEMP1, putative [Plasmodium sp. DRC-Itaito]